MLEASHSIGWFAPPPLPEVPPFKVALPVGATKEDWFLSPPPPPLHVLRPLSYEITCLTTLETAIKVVTTFSWMGYSTLNTRYALNPCSILPFESVP